MLKVLIDFDGTLTDEEMQAGPLVDKWLHTLANEILRLPRHGLAKNFERTLARVLRTPDRYSWEVNGLAASYSNEGPFILATTTMQIMLKENPAYARAAAARFPQAQYDPVTDCIVDLFHRHTAELPAAFRPTARGVLTSLARRPKCIPIVLTNSLADKARRELAVLLPDIEIAILGDTRQYEMAPYWRHCFAHPELGEVQIWPVSPQCQVDLRRPAYYHALLQAAADGSRLVVVADTFSLAGALPLMMGIPFLLLRTSYTPPWCIETVSAHPLGYVLEDLSNLPAALDALCREL